MVTKAVLPERIQEDINKETSTRRHQQEDINKKTSTRRHQQGQRLEKRTLCSFVSERIKTKLNLGFIK